MRHIFFFVIPAAVVLWWFVAEALGLSQRKLRTLAHVAATTAEEAQRAKLESVTAARQNAVDALWAEGDRKQLRRRSDGMFDQRSYLGRDLNLKLETECSQLSGARSLLFDHVGAIQARVNHWARRNALVTGARAGIVTFFVVGGAMLVLQPAMAASIGRLNFLVDKADAQTQMLLGSLAIAGACALGVNFAVFTIRRRDLLS